MEQEKWFGANFKIKKINKVNFFDWTHNKKKPIKRPAQTTWRMFSLISNTLKLVQKIKIR